MSAFKNQNAKATENLAKMQSAQMENLTKMNQNHKNNFGNQPLFNNPMGSNLGGGLDPFSNTPAFGFDPFDTNKKKKKMPKRYGNGGV